MARERGEESQSGRQAGRRARTHIHIYTHIFSLSYPMNDPNARSTVVIKGEPFASESDVTTCWIGASSRVSLARERVTFAYEIGV